MADIRSNFFKSYSRAYDLIEIVFCIYKLAQSTIQRGTIKSNLCIKLMAVILAACSLMFLCGVVLITFLYVKTIDLILYFKLGETYGGRLSEETIFNVAAEPCFVTFLFIFNYDGTEDEFRAFLRQVLLKFYNSNFRFSSTLAKFSGYSYYVKNRYSFDEVAQEINCPNADNLSKEALLLRLLKDCDEPPLPALWSLKIVSLPSTGIHGKICPVIMKYHHAIADGVSLFSLLAKVFNEEKSISGTINTDINLGCKEFSNIRHDLSNLARRCIHSNILTRSKRKKLQIKNAKTNQMAIYYEEENQGKYMDLIKRIKNKIEGLTFTEVLFTVFASSLHEHYSQISNCPEKLNFVMMTRPRCEENLNFYRGIYDSDHYGNHVIMAYFPLPFGKFLRISERLLVVHEKWRPKNILDDQLNFWFRKLVMRYWPDRLIKLGLPLLYGVDVGLTNLPGISLKNFHGAKLQSFFFYVPMILDENFRLFIGTQDRRFHILLAAKEDAGLSNTDLQNILIKMFTYLDALDEETRDFPSNNKRDEKVVFQEKN